jgi:hypothetical protein
VRAVQKGIKLENRPSIEDPKKLHHQLFGVFFVIRTYLILVSKSNGAHSFLRLSELGTIGYLRNVTNNFEQFICQLLMLHFWSTFKPDFREK